MRGADHFISSIVNRDTIKCIQLSCEEKTPKGESVFQILWNEHYLCQRLGTFGVLFTDLSASKLRTILLQNSQLALTRAFQSLLNTSSRVLTVANSNEFIYFLYNSMELQVFDTQSKSWIHSFRLPL